MTVRFDHTIVSARDSEESAAFLANILGLPAPTHVGPFVAVALDNGATLDFIDDDEAIESRHFAFRVTEAAFDEIFGRIKERGLSHWADPARSRPGETYHHEGGRGVYFEDPSGHFLEILTRPGA
ncbi:MAG TPA: VOC family protein [Acidimicrobiia bacterium]|nr:VOC family protein [Acidimicrobiia bacterium]